MLYSKIYLLICIIRNENKILNCEIMENLDEIIKYKDLNDKNKGIFFYDSDCVFKYQTGLVYLKDKI